jgi:hypothetical protein
MNLDPFVFHRAGTLVANRATDDLPAPLDADTLAAVNRFTLRPLESDAFAVFTMDLCHNQIDRHHSRFPDEELARIDTMVPGRPFMERHDLRGSLPRGTFFRSRLHREGDRLLVRPDVYVLRTAENNSFIRSIEGGVYRETSIGFSFRLPECAVCKKDLRTCAHVPGRSYGDTVCHFVMRDVLEVIEGSIVPAGSQGTTFVSGTRDAAGPPGLYQALEDARRAYHAPIELEPCGTWSRE